MRRTAPALAFLACFGLAQMPAGANAQYGGASAPAPETPRPHHGSSAQPAAAAAAAPVVPGDLLHAAACVLGHDANAGNALLTTVPRSAEERTQAGAFIRTAQHCLRQTTPIPATAPTLRGAVAESLYEMQFATPVAARAPVVIAAPLVRPAASDPMAESLATVYSLAECTVSRHSDMVRAFLVSDPAPPGEQAAFTALNPAFNGCVVPGTQLRVDMRALRSIFAEALYHWSVVQRDGQASPWAAPAGSPPPPPAH